MKNRISFSKKKRKNPLDSIFYVISHRIIKKTENILKEYGKLGHEGLVYWGGYKILHNNNIIIDTVICPNTNSDNLRIETDKNSNSKFVNQLRRHERIYISQVHSHPGEFTDHSLGDDLYAAFRSIGLLSIVVPEYGENGMVPLKKCGIHRFTDGKFIRLSNRYILNHFKIDNDLSSICEDLRE